MRQMHIFVHQNIFESRLANVLKGYEVTKTKLTILGSCADDLVALDPIPLLGEGGHLDVVAGEGLQSLQADLRGPSLLTEDQIRAWTEILREGM